MATLGLSIVYFKLLSIGTYVPLIYANYKYPIFDKIIENKTYKKYEEKLVLRYPKLSKGIQIISYSINKSGEFVAKVTVKQVQNWMNTNVCHKRLTKALIHTSLSYKLLLPVYAYASYSLAKKHVK